MNGTFQGNTPLTAQRHGVLPDASHSATKRLLPTLRSLGADQYDIHVPETNRLPQLLTPTNTLRRVSSGSKGDI